MTIFSGNRKTKETAYQLTKSLVEIKNFATRILGKKYCEDLLPFDGEFRSWDSTLVRGNVPMLAVLR